MNAFATCRARSAILLSVIGGNYGGVIKEYAKAPLPAQRKEVFRFIRSIVESRGSEFALSDAVVENIRVAALQYCSDLVSARYCFSPESLQCLFQLVFHLF